MPNPTFNFYLITGLILVLLGIGFYIVRAIKKRGGIILYKADYAQFSEFRDQLGIIKFSPNFMFVTDQVGHITWVNKKAIRTLGFTESELKNNKLIYSLIPKQYIPDIENLKDNHSDEKDESVIRVELCKKDNTSFPVELSIGKTEIVEGTERVCYIFRDIKHRLQAEETTRTVSKSLEQTIKYYMAAESMLQFGYWNLNVFTGRVEITPGMSRIYGVPSSLNKSGFMLERVEPDDRIIVSDALNKLKEDFQQYEIIFRVNPMDGYINTVKTMGRAILNPNDATQLTNVEGISIIIKREKSKWI